MRKLFFCMLAILGAVACDWETMEVAEQVEVPVSNATTVTVRAGKAGTRTSISEQNGKYVVGWKAGDKLAVIEGVPTIAWMVMNNPDYNGTAAMLYGTEGLDADTDNAEFTLELDERDDVSGTLQYVAIYPASAAIDVPDAWDYENNRIYATIDFPQSQNPSADSFDPNADVLVSKVVTCQNSRPRQLSFEFARVGTIIKMVVNGLPEGSKISDGFIQLGIEAGYYMNYDPVDQKMKYSDGTDGIIFNYNEGEEPEVGADRTATIWLRCMSGVTDHISLDLNCTSPNGYYSYYRNINLRAKGKTLEFKEGGLTTFIVDMKTPDVPNPAQEDIDFKTNNPSFDGIDVWWTIPENEFLQGYECMLRDEDGTAYPLTNHVIEGNTFTASISGGLAPGTYSLFVRALAVDGKVSQLDYVEKELEIGIPKSLNISYTSSHNTYMGDYYDLNLESSTDLYRGIYFNLRYLSWHGGSPNHFDGAWYDNIGQGCAIWNATPYTWVRVSVETNSSYTTGNYEVYASDTIFTDGVPGDATPISASKTEGYIKTFDLGYHKYFLLYGVAPNTLHINEICLEYYK